MSYATEVFADAPVGYWPLTEASGDALDKSGNGNDGTILTLTQGDTELVSGSGGSYDFDGAAGEVDAASPAVLDDAFDGGGSIECWINARSDGGGDNGAITGKQNWRLRCRIEAGGFLAIEFFHVWSGTDIQWRSGVDVAINARHHLVVTYDNDATGNVPILYVDGVASATFAVQTGPPTGTRTTDAGQDFLVGDRVSAGQTFDGHLSHVALYASVLSAARVLAHYTAGVGRDGEVATHALDVDFDGDEVFEAAGAVTSDTIPSGALIRSSRGVDASRRLSPPAAGSARFALDDGELHGNGAYNPAGNLKRGRRVRWRATYGPTTYGLWSGVLDSVEQDPRRDRRIVHVNAHGPLSRLVNTNVSTALFATLSSDVAIGHLLDGAGFPRNLSDYVTVDLADKLAGFWKLGEASGVAVDSSPGGNDGTVTIGAGARDAAALDEDGDGAIDFDSASTLINMSNPAELTDIFAGGGSFAFAFNADSDGEGSAGNLAGKISWSLRVQDESGGLVRLRFLADFATDGVWETAVDIPIGAAIFGVLSYDSDAVGNNPTLYLWDGTAFSVRTVGAGLTETVTPIGSYVTDSARAFTVGNVAGQTATFDGRLDSVASFSTELTAAEAGGYIARSIQVPRRLDAGKTILDYWWLDEEDAMQALTTLVSTEGPGAVVYEDGAGRLIFKNRHARVEETRSQTVQDTFRSAEGAVRPHIGAPFTFDPGLKDVVNRCVVTHKKRAAADLSVIWELGEVLTIGPAQTRMIEARLTQKGDPFTGAIVPVEGVDFMLDSGAVTAVTLNRTSGAAVEISITATAAGAVISGLEMRGQAVAVTETSSLTSQLDVAQSQADHGVFTYPLPVRAEIPLQTAQDFCDAVVFWFKNGQPTARLVVDAFAMQADMEAALARDVNDRVRIIDTSTGIDKQFWVDRISQTVAPPSAQRVLLECTEVETTPFILGTSALGGADVIWF